ncbi:hypothetical protein H257_16657 [Aphanomyces astaci]|uniref:Uncharacterized protein n=1 Tax=Aphanomyces astaci TaxID=112090 RepID=W4FJU7_APHAT|nr:hypothetical protein H257_16657 [Aphanomyces astaci]ETV67116.1 hypothetical protein H257_16657 [Aphanomyces astaci]|eukprot:XP_009843485.1 hypothetical protein H257_16657 [Aphanomyces astaci]
MQRDPLNVTFAEYFRCRITTKLIVARDTTIDVVSVLVVNTVSTTIADYHADASNTKKLWDPEGPANTTQNKYVKLTLLSYNNVVRRVWDNASKARNA